MKNRTLPLAFMLLTATAVGVRASVRGDEAGFRSQIDVLSVELSAALSLPVFQAPDVLTPAQARALVKKKLQGSGVPDSYVDSVFDDARTTVIDGISERFGRPAESLPYEEYRKFFLTEANIANGARFARDHAGLLMQVNGRTGVDGTLLTALTGIETRYGTYVGKFQVFSALYTIILKVQRRSDWAAREEAEVLKLCWKHREDPHAIVGSYAGAFGFVQFMPSSFNTYAVDFDGDGRTRWDEWPDALGSAANYLLRHGYDSSAPFEPGSPIGRSIYAYNHSDNYVRAMLELRAEILKRLP
ncbi:MAG: hypothetical protein A2506_03400 [Elusimicrobia bacterium RIFOXYD12_FULL_66_9]|nr:MAG: hypothetical protein A2506_03400 [Elusimicrobia bacterium RIFOXYD12_FULL_66_9]